MFPNDVMFDGITIDAPLQGQHVQCLIGRDSLAHGVMLYLCYMDQFTLSF